MEVREQSKIVATLQEILCERLNGSYILWLKVEVAWLFPKGRGDVTWNAEEPMMKEKTHKSCLQFQWVWTCELWMSESVWPWISVTRRRACRMANQNADDDLFGDVIETRRWQAWPNGFSRLDVLKEANRFMSCLYAKISEHLLKKNKTPQTTPTTTTTTIT